MKQAVLEKNAVYAALILTPLFLVLLALLHFLEPEFAPSWRMISEYELGRFGWVMQVAFIVLAIATIGAFLAVRPHIQTFGGKVGLGLLLVAAVGLILGASFITDPITIDPANGTTSGAWHNVGGSLMILPTPFTAVFVSWSLARRNKNWKASGRSLLWPTILIWVTIIWFFAVVASGAEAATAGPDVPMGWPNRAFMAAYCYWLIVITWQSLKIRRGD